MATRTISAAGGNSNVAATYDENQVPTASDDIVARADGTSGNFVIAANLSCRSFNMTSTSVSGGTYSASITRTAGNLSIGTSTAPPSGIAFAISSSLTWNVVGSLLFISTAATTQTASFGGVTINSPIQVTGNSLTMVFSDSFTGTTFLINGNDTTTARFDAAVTFTSTCTLTRGVWSVNGKALSVSSLVFSSNASVRTLSMGTGGYITVTNNTNNVVSVQGTTTNLTVTGSGTIELNGNAPVNNGARVTLRGVDFSGTSNGITWLESCPSVSVSSRSVRYQCGTGTLIGVFGNFTRTGAAEPLADLSVEGELRVNNNLTLTGANATSGRLMVHTGGGLSTDTRGGTQQQITCNGTLTVSNCDFRDILGAGTASWNLASITGNSGDAGGNSGITFTSSATQTWAGGAGGSWSDPSKWTSRVPLPQDDVIVNSGSGTLSMDTNRQGKNQDFTGYTGQLSFGSAAGGTIDIHGNLTLGSGMQSTATTNPWCMVGRGSHTITTNGKILAWDTFIITPTGTYALADAMTISRSGVDTLKLGQGTFDANDFDITLTGSNGGFTMSTGTLYMGNGIWTFQGGSSHAFWSINGGTVNCEGSTISCTWTSTAATHTFTGGGQTYNVLQFTGASAGGGAVEAIAGANTFASLIATGSNTRTLRLPASTTTTITGLLRLKDGTSLTSSTAGTPATISAA